MIGYGIGYVGQGSTYNFMGSYFVIFLTNSAGMGSAMAGTITSIALLAEVLTGMIVGNLSDHCKSSMGKRRPFVLISACSMPIIMLLIMRTIGGSIELKFAYYLILSILFRLSFATFEIPNNAFGAEIASGYDERTRLRTASRAFSIIGNTLGYVMPLWVLELFPTDESAGWQTIGLIISVVAFGSWFGSFLLTKKKAMEIMEEERKAVQTEKTVKQQGGNRMESGKESLIKDIFSNYLELCRLKTMRLLIIYKAAFGCAFALFNVATIYYLRYSLGLDNRYSSYMYVLTIMVFIITTPFANKMAIVMGKARQQMTCMAVGAVVGCIVFFAAPQSLAGAACYVIAFSVMQTSFWQLSSSIFYDIAEVDEFVNFKRREGDIMSLVSVLGTLITAVIVQFFGIFLDMSGFNAASAVQSDSVIHFLNAAYILTPSICFAVGFVSLAVFPINKQTFNSLIKALALRREGKSYELYMEDIQKLL